MGDFYIIAFFEPLLRIIANPLLFTGIEGKLWNKYIWILNCQAQLIAIKLLNVLMHCPTAFSLYSPYMYGENNVDLGVICFF